ncbi:MAG TPA: hypothetical protein VJZ75_06330 [Candidatus Bathyarchaeia archaeon]|nr:hypothetical protein [Candidatus Bathyarchaeia archaeon]
MAATELVDRRTLETLTTIGLTPNETQSFIGRLDSSNLQLGTPISIRRHSMFRRLALLLWGYSFSVWVYVVAMQIRYPDSVYWPFATWLPIRMDFLGEAAFAFSIILASALILTNTRRDQRLTGAKPR